MKRNIRKTSSRKISLSLYVRFFYGRDEEGQDRENETERDKDRETERKREGEMGVASEVKRRCQGPEARKYAVS